MLEILNLFLSVILYIFSYILSIGLILIILLRVPKENAGLSSFLTKNNFLDSLNSTDRLSIIVLSSSTLLFFGVAIALNLLK